MRAIFIAVGSELLEKNRIDTNSIYVSQKLMEKGILMDMKVVVGDDITNLSWIIKNACKRTQLVVVTGGLGPTEDDVTREAAAEALKRELEFKEVAFLTGTFFIPGPFKRLYSSGGGGACPPVSPFKARGI